MSRADQLLSKLPPPTQLPSFVTDALNGTWITFLSTLVVNVLFLFFRFRRASVGADESRAGHHGHDGSKLSHSDVFVSTCTWTRRRVFALYCCVRFHVSRPVITSKNEETPLDVPASPSGETGTDKMVKGEQSSSKGDLFNWMKGSSSSIFSMVAEKAKNSVDAVLTTLDPQMKDALSSNIH